MQLRFHEGVASHKAYSELMFDHKHLHLFSLNTSDTKPTKKIKMAKTDKEKKLRKLSSHSQSMEHSL